ncbi:alkylation response protein AidB-like acyl-CoA dehydrogenase [Herbihabitans rhizosphaerae]|uniref:Alkylation response protein AidB-like acyl-CoA dehydrogenase n=1 Tax=Herbihabitans rhizosphaerae TaxID=1872711 RepID=A0A4Q7KDR6_9PSEU|nr:acyl-CoA dehydrogenase family protein [Herbihabitans rhizosphaerae]RZS32374.1 alkylation response protein AidB-like acyl-CoA dehydrogenase [Herbihabitans rhizosphaerae]
MTATARLNVSEEFPALLERIDALGESIEADADAAETLGRLTDDIARALLATGIVRAGLPKNLGGDEFSPRQLIQTTERLSYHDATAGWTMMGLQMVTGATAAYLGAVAAADLFPDVAGGDHALLAGHGTRPGRAVPVDDGYLVSGNWQFASGMALATHIHSLIQIEGTEEFRVLAMPKSQVNLVDNWDVLGLRATTSIDYNCADAFVPKTHTYLATTMAPANGGAIYRIGLVNMSAIVHTGWALGVGRRLLDELKRYASRRFGTRNAAVDTAQFHAEYANAEAKLRAARAWAMHVWHGNEDTLAAGESLSTEQDTLIRLALNHATGTAQDVAQTVHRWAATTAIRRGPIDRFLRDLGTGTQHITSGPVVLQNCGKWLSGAESDAHWEFLDLVP